jgi:hypothetical protein
VIVTVITKERVKKFGGEERKSKTVAKMKELEWLPVGMPQERKRLRKRGG